MNDDEMREEFKRHEHTLDVENRKRHALFILFACLVFTGSLVLTHPWDFYMLAAIGLYVTAGLLAFLIPGRCVVCNRWTSFSGPRNGSKRRAWWDMRLRSRADMVFVCPQHVPTYLLASYHPQREQ